MSKAKPFTQRTGEVWINGKFEPVEQVNIPLLTHGLHYGSTVFEGERAYEGRIFKSAEHTRRLMRSCELLGFTFPFEFDVFEAAKRETLLRTGLSDAYFRAIAWRGSGQLGVGSGDNRINVAIACWPMEPYFDPKSGGVRLDIANWRRPPPDCAPVKAKAAGLYTICTLSKDTAMQNGFDDALMLDLEGRISECTGAHIFFVKNGELHTPRKDWMIDGITRATVIEMAKKRQIKVIERFIQPEEISDFPESFIVGSAVEVVPVRQIGEKSMTPGQITDHMVADYQKIVRDHVS